MFCYYLCPGSFAVRKKSTLFFSRWNRPIVAGGTTWWCDVGWCLEILWTIATMAASWDDWIDSKSLGRLVGWEGGRNWYMIYIYTHQKKEIESKNWMNTKIERWLWWNWAYETTPNQMSWVLRIFLHVSNTQKYPLLTMTCQWTSTHPGTELKPGEIKG